MLTVVPAVLGPDVLCWKWGLIKMTGAGVVDGVLMAPSVAEDAGRPQGPRHAGQTIQTPGLAARQRPG